MFSRTLDLLQQLPQDAQEQLGANTGARAHTRRSYAIETEKPVA